MSRYHQSYGAKPQSFNTKSQYYADTRKQVETQLSSREIQMMKSLFNMFDLDNSDKISREEFKSTLRSLGYTTSDEEIEKMMNSFDSNRDGLLDFKEFLSMVKHLKSNGHEYGKEAFEKQIRNAFRFLDADNDGYLTHRELRHVLCNTGNRLSRAEMEDFIKMFDQDNDGRISCDELITNMCSSLEDHLRALIP